MAASPIHIVVDWAKHSPEDARQAQEQVRPQHDQDFSWFPVAQRLAAERMRARGVALGAMAAAAIHDLRPPVQVGTVLLVHHPSDHWLVRVLGEDLPGGFSEIPVPLQVEADAMRHVPAAEDEIRFRIRGAVKNPRGAR